MAPKHHPTPLSGGDRKALQKELGKARAMTNILAAQSAEMRAKAESMLQQADRLLCESWNERMWSDGEPIDPTPTIDQAVNGGFPWLEIQCARCKTPSDVDLAAMKHPDSQGDVLVTRFPTGYSRERYANRQPDRIAVSLSHVLNQIVTLGRIDWQGCLWSRAHRAIWNRSVGI